MTILDMGINDGIQLITADLAMRDDNVRMIRCFTLKLEVTASLIGGCAVVATDKINNSFPRVVVSSIVVAFSLESRFRLVLE